MVGCVVWALAACRLDEVALIGMLKSGRGRVHPIFLLVT